MLVKKYAQLSRTNVALAALLALMFSFTSVSQLFAVESETNSVNTLKISPIRTDVEIRQGKTKTVKTVVTNLTNSPVTVQAIENDFVAGDEKGTPALILDEDEYAPTHSLKRFMQPLANVTIPANESKSIDVVISVPADAQAGGYFGAIRFAPAALDDGGQVNLSASVASLILLKVPGDIVEDIDLDRFDVQQSGKTGEYFGSPDDIQVLARFTNNGNVQIGPFGKVSVKNGDDVVYESDFNIDDPRDLILPDSARTWEIPLEELDNFGHYTVQATFTYGEENKTIEVSKSFWVIPQIYIIAAIVAVVALLGLIIGIWLFLRNYKRRILRSHNRSRRR